MNRPRSGIAAIFGKPVRIFLFSDDAEIVKKLTRLWRKSEAQWSVFVSGRDLLEHLFSQPPHMLICALSGEDMDGLEIIRMVKMENVFRQVCTVLLLTAEHLRHMADWGSVEVDDFLLLPLQPHELRPRLELALYRSTRTLDANPLTRLPGNASIVQAVERYSARGEHFALAYVDIDNFKSFNDKYSFSRGDEALLMTARLIASTVMGLDENPRFVGHVGGDDFVFILPAERMEETCQTLISAYDAIVPSFYDARDRARGCIAARNRQGHIHTFPLISLSIAVVIDGERYSHYGELSHVVGQLKSHAKNQRGSCYVVDRRKY